MRYLKVYIQKKINGEIFNIGSGKKISIKNFINLVRKLIGKGQPCIGGLKYKKETNMNNYPNIKKAKIKLNWKPKISLIEGLKKTVTSF